MYIDSIFSVSCACKRRNPAMKVQSMLSVLIVSTALLASQDTVKRTQDELHRLHQDSKAYIAFLEDPQRDAYQKPHEVITALDLKEGEVIADVGAGSGYFSLRFANQVGERGRVYAVDISPDMIRYLNRRIRDLNLRNVVTILAEPDDPLLPDGSIDRFFLCDTWHHIENRTAYLALMKRMLRPGGQVVMIDFQKRELPVGPPVEMKIAREDLLREMEAGGFRLTREHTFLPYQYFLVFAVI
jgi:SAM-dependent methyltransferase